MRLLTNEMMEAISGGQLAPSVAVSVSLPLDLSMVLPDLPIGLMVLGMYVSADVNPDLKVNTMIR